MSEIKFSKSHEWAKIDGVHAVIGITDYAQHELGDIVFVELPAVGQKLQQAGRFGTVESTKAASELYSPLSGEVIDINRDLENNPQWINEDPLGKGWIIKIKVENRKETDLLLAHEAYKDFIELEQGK